MLSSALVNRYSITINPIFNLLLLLYPFALVYFLLGFKKSIENIQRKFGFHPMNLFLYAVSYYYILMTALNDGFSSFFLGVSYALFLIWEIFMLQKKSKARYLHILVMFLSLFLLFFDRSHSRFFYPMVGKSYTIVKNINYTYGDAYVNFIDIYGYNPVDMDKPMFQFLSGESFEILTQKVAGHPDMSTTYIYQIRSNSFFKLRKYLSDYQARIKPKYFGDKIASIFIVMI